MEVPETMPFKKPTKPSLLIAGSVAKDELIRRATTRKAWGGVPIYAGQTAYHMGWAVEAWTALPARDALAIEAAYPGIKWRISPSAEATRFINRETPGKERLQHCTSQAAMLLMSMPNHPANQHWDWVHLGPLHPGDLALDAAQSLVQQASKSSLDVQGLVRQMDDQGRIVPGIAPAVEAWLNGVSWVKASVAEWAMLKGHLAMDGPQARAHFGWEGLLVTAGEQGGIAYSAEGQFAWEASLPAAVRMETGAGDVFMAAFLSTIGNQQKPRISMPDALELAAKVAGEHVAGRGLQQGAGNAW